MRVIIHIGTPKTGSTAIQRFLFENLDEILRSGVLYPASGLANKDAFGPRHKRLTHNGPHKPDHWRKLIAEIGRHHEGDLVIVSCEAFWNYPEHVAQIAEYLSNHDVTVVAVLRRQDGFVASSYLHRVTYAGFSGSPDEAFEELQGACDYLSVLNVWDQYFHVETVLYQHGGLLPHFLAACGTPPAVVDLARKREADYHGANPTIGVKSARLLQAYDNLGLPLEQREALVHLLRRAEPRSRHAQDILGLDLAKEIRRKYRAGNARLFKKFFGLSGYSDAAWRARTD